MADLLHLLRQVVEAVTAATDLHTSLNQLVSRVRRGLGVEACTIYLWDEELKRYVLMATDGLRAEAIGKTTLGRREGLIGLVGKREEPLNLADASNHPSFFSVADIGEEALHGLLAVPVIHSRRLLGVLLVQQHQKARFAAEAEAFMVTLSAQLAGLIAHAEVTGILGGKNLLGEKATDDIRFVGIACAAGIAIGPGFAIAPAVDLAQIGYSKSADIHAERVRFNKAIRSLRSELAATRQNLSSELRPEELALFDVYVGILEDEAVGGKVLAKIHDGETAVSAVASTMRSYVQHFQQMDDGYLRERAADMRDLGQRLLSRLNEEHDKRDIPQGAILIGEDLSATLFANLEPGWIAGVVSTQGSANSHLAILARALNIPTILGAQDIPWQQLEGKELVVDGYHGHIYCQLSEERRSHFAALVKSQRHYTAELTELIPLANETRDGRAIDLLVNTGLQSDLHSPQTAAADGVGLFRTEVPFMLQGRFPSEEEQATIYRNQLLAFHPKPVTMRTLDIGGDKSLEYFPIDEANPFLGWRGLRVTLDHPEIFIVQIRAMLRASNQLNNLRIMLPMVTSVSEVEDSLALIHRAVHELNDEGVDVSMPKVGVMIEVPSAVYLIKDFLPLIDFISVGSNDLTQYLLAVDRNNPRVADIYDGLHPAVLKALKIIIVETNQSSVPVSVCGELAGDPMGAVALLGLGYRHLSMSNANMLRVKAVIRQLDWPWAENLANELLTLDDPKLIRSTLRLALTNYGIAAADLGLLASG